MPRDSSGVYTLPIAPFVPLTLAKSADMNTALSDITGTLGVSGATSLAGTLGVTGNAGVSGNLAVSNTATVTGKLNLPGIRGFANNAAAVAGGLGHGDVYFDLTVGALSIVF
jgi:hypothetical protein